MDDIDRRLLALLREDASAPLKVLAEAVGLARSSVSERIDRLKQRQIIRRFTIELDPSWSGARAFLHICLRQTPDRDTVAQIVEHPNVVRCWSLAGAVDLCAELAADNTLELNGCRDALAGLDGVASVETTFVLKLEKGD